MLKVPEFDEPTQPVDSTILKLKNSTLFLASIIVEFLGIFVTIFNFKDLSYEVKIIISLSITCIVLFTNVILLYIKDRENYFKSIYLRNMYESLCNEINQVQKKADILNENVDELKSRAR